MSLDDNVTIMNIAKTLSDSCSSSNVIKYGGVIDNNSVLYNFAPYNYVELPELFNPQDKSWEIKLKIKSGQLTQEEQVIFSTTVGKTNGTRFGTRIWIDSDNNNYLVANMGIHTDSWDFINTDYVILPNTIYYIKYSFDLTKYTLSISTDDITYTDYIVEDSTPIQPNVTTYLGNWSNYVIGNYTPFYGEIDLKESYIKINNEVWWTGIDTEISDLSFSKELMNTITSIMMPDYTKGIKTNLPEYPTSSTVQYTPNTFIAPNNGYICIFGSKNNAGNNLMISVNDIVVGVLSAESAFGASLLIPVCKHDVVHAYTNTANQGWRILTQWFFPCRGAI